MLFDGETKISTGKQWKQGEENPLNSNLKGKHILVVSSIYLLRGNVSAGSFQ